jgi:hypothetical protein
MYIMVFTLWAAQPSISFDGGFAANKPQYPAIHSDVAHCVWFVSTVETKVVFSAMSSLTRLPLLTAAAAAPAAAASAAQQLGTAHRLLWRKAEVLSVCQALL